MNPLQRITNWWWRQLAEFYWTPEQDRAEQEQWVAKQADSLRALRGRRIVRWAGVEMAVGGDCPGETVQWYDETVPFLQLDRVDLVLSEGPVVSISTDQSFTGRCLGRVDNLPPSNLPSDAPGSIFRARTLDELPTGEIAAVDVIVDETINIAEIWLGVGGREVSFRAGEVDDQSEGIFKVILPDESILVQVDGRRPDHLL